MTDDQLELAASIIEKDIRKHYSLQELAHMAGINVLQLKTGFKERYGVGPFHYLSNLRLQRAKQLLTQTNTPIRYISLQCGYKSNTSFQTAFKRKFHYPPGYFRKQTK